MRLETSWIAVVALPVVALASACAHPAASTPPQVESVAWIDAPLLGAASHEVDTLDALGRGTLQARQVRLDRLLDLFDAARFGQDPDARETLWGGLGGNMVDRGPRASREATERILQQALALEDDAYQAADEAVARFAGDLIVMLSNDLQAPGSAEDLSIRTLVYRTLVEQGHPRLADNARWRLYDHARGTLAGAVEAPADQRMAVAVQALYAERDSVQALLADTAPHARPPWPSAQALWGLVQTQRDDLATAPRWAPVVQRRDHDDDTLHDTLRTVLPAARDAAWPVSSLPAGTARVESLAPVVQVDAERIIIDAGRPHARTVALSGEREALARAVGNAVAQDGRGTVLVVADPMLPAPQLRTLLEALHQAQVGRVELAVREARIDPEAGEVVMALPLHATHAAGTRAGDRAWQQARVHVQLDGRGAMFAVDGRWLDQRPTGPQQTSALVRSIARAYPRERGVRVSLAGDVQLRQVIALWVALAGGPDRPFAAVGWAADGSMPPPSRQAGDARLARRTALAWESPRIGLDQPYPLATEDQARLEGFARDIAVCLPELEAKSTPKRIDLKLEFTQGRLRKTSVQAPRRSARVGVTALVDCVEQQGYALRLRGHREGLTVEVAFAPPSSN